MADKRAELEKSLTKLNRVRDRIAAQLEKAESKVKQLQSVVNTEFFEEGESKSLQALSLKREEVTSLHQTLQSANHQVNEARQALEDHDLAVRGGQIQELDRKIIEMVINLQVAIGENGLKAEVDKLGELIAALEPLSASNVKVHGVAEHIASARGIHNQLTHSLLASWQAIEGLKWGPAHATDTNRSNYLPGFGVRPGFLKSA
jgi:DNA repair exonuclease SbcCD ATPase subunit